MRRDASVGVTQQRGARFGHQQAVARQRAIRGAVEQHGELFGVLGSESAQGRDGDVHRTDEGCAGVHAFLGLQPLKRLKISEPLVPPKPKEFDSAESMDILRAVFGT